MQRGGLTFQINTDNLERLAKKIGNQTVKYDKVMKQRVTRATEMVWRIAHAKRPMISKAQMKFEGRTKRVSDPNAKAGVPVDTGVLQGSITQKVSKTKSMSYQGEVATRGVPYAGYLEFGTSKMRARPFIRPAVNLTKDAIKRVFGLKVEANI